MALAKIFPYKAHVVELGEIFIQQKFPCINGVIHLIY